MLTRIVFFGRTTVFCSGLVTMCHVAFDIFLQRFNLHIVFRPLANNANRRFKFRFFGEGVVTLQKNSLRCCGCCVGNWLSFVGNFEFKQLWFTAFERRKVVDSRGSGSYLSGMVWHFSVTDFVRKASNFGGNGSKFKLRRIKIWTTWSVSKPSLKDFFAPLRKISLIVKLECCADKNSKRLRFWPKKTLRTFIICST